MRPKKEINKKLLVELFFDSNNYSVSDITSLYNERESEKISRMTVYRFLRGIG